MPDSFRFVALAVAAVMTAALCLGAAENGSLSHLPADSSVVFGVELDALCGDPQGALVFSELEKICGIPLKNLDRVLIASDRKWRKWTILFQVKEGGDLDGFCAFLPELPAKEKLFAGRTGYLLSGKAGDKNIAHLYRVSGNEAIVVYPVRRHRKSAASRSDAGMLAAVRKILPARELVLFWGAGIIREKKFLLKNLQSFSFALEKTFDDKLLLHGRIVCKENNDAAVTEMLLKASLSTVLQSKAGISAEEAGAAVDSFNIIRKENVLYFSTVNFKPVLILFVHIVRKKMPELPVEMTK